MLSGLFCSLTYFDRFEILFMENTRISVHYEFLVRNPSSYRIFIQANVIWWLLISNYNILLDIPYQRFIFVYLFAPRITWKSFHELYSNFPSIFVGWIRKINILIYPKNHSGYRIFPGNWMYFAQNFGSDNTNKTRNKIYRI